MARGDRSIAGFGEVAGKREVNENKNVIINNNDDININDIINNNENKKQLIGIYFDSDVAAVLKSLAAKGSKGAQSQLVNAAVKKLFQDKGLM